MYPVSKGGAVGPSRTLLQAGAVGPEREELRVGENGPNHTNNIKIVKKE